MKIGHPVEQPTPLPAAAPAPAAAAAAGDSAKAAATAAAIPAQADASAKIELSNTASTLLSGSSTAEFDAEKVARVAKAIGDGSFKVNPEVIADKLIANAQELLTQAKPDAQA